jgi:phage terminase small subunit
VKPSKPRAPGHLSLDARRWWSDVVREYELDAHHLKLLTLAAGAWDRAEQARVALAEAASLTYTDRFGQPHARPEVAIERDGRISFARLVRELSLDEDSDVRPPRIGGR